MTSLLLVLPLALLINFYICSAQKQDNIDEAYTVAENKAVKLQYAIETRLLNTEILKTLVVRDSGEVEEFEKTAKFIYDDDSALRSIQLAPKGVVTYIYPIARNEEGFMDLFSDPERKTEAEWARDTGQMTLAGPYELMQGGKGIVARNPIYLTDKDGNDNFWGFSIAILNVPDIFDKADLDSLTKDKYYYHILRNIPNSDEVQVIYSNTTEELSNAIKTNIELPNVTWQLEICPMEGWLPKHVIFENTLVMLMASFALAFLLSKCITLVKQKKELIHRTNTDSLTGLYNYRFYINKTNELADAEHPFTLFYIDVNNFKQFNSKYGHGEGDNLIAEIAFRIKQCVSDEDYATHIGSDGFVIIIPSDKSEERCSELKERLRSHISVPYELFEGTVTPAVSIGYARYPEDSSNVEKVMWLADNRMYKEKKQANM